MCVCGVCCVVYYPYGRQGAFVQPRLDRHRVPDKARRREVWMGEPWVASGMGGHQEASIGVSEGVLWVHE